MGDTIALNRRSLVEKLNQLLKERNELGKKMSELRDPNGTVYPQYLDVSERFQRVQATLSDTREWYTLSIQESLDKSARSLNRLTMALIALTGVLAVLTVTLALFRI